MNQNLLSSVSGKEEGDPSDVLHPPPGLQCELLGTLSPPLLPGRAGLVLWKALVSTCSLPSCPGLPLPPISGDQDNIHHRGLGEDPELVCVEDLEQCLALSRHSINGRYPEDHLCECL